MYPFVAASNSGYDWDGAILETGVFAIPDPNACDSSPEDQLFISMCNAIVDYTGGHNPTPPNDSDIYQFVDLDMDVPGHLTKPNTSMEPANLEEFFPGPLTPVDSITFSPMKDAIEDPVLCSEATFMTRSDRMDDNDQCLILDPSNLGLSANTTEIVQCVVPNQADIIQSFPPFVPQAPPLSKKIQSFSPGSLLQQPLNEKTLLASVGKHQRANAEVSSMATLFTSVEEARESCRRNDLLPLDHTLPISAEEKCIYVAKLKTAFKSMTNALDGENVKRAFKKSNYNPNSKKPAGTFAQRFEDIQDGLVLSKSICKHLIDPFYVHTFVDNPIAARKRVQSNKKVNDRKSTQISAGKKALGHNSPSINFCKDTRMA